MLQCLGKYNLKTIKIDNINNTFISYSTKTNLDK